MIRSIIVFSKSPLLGRVKTRLCKPIDNTAISQKEALEIHTAFLCDTTIKVTGIKKANFFLYYDGEEGVGALQQAVKGLNFKNIVPQKGDSLGERLYNAFYDHVSHTNDMVLIIGIDSPTLPRNLLEKGFSLLKNNEVVMGPATDGGYYLIGMKGTAFKIFDAIEWGGENVALQTLAILKEKKISLGLLPIWYDVDTVTDLLSLKTELDLLHYAKKSVPEYTYRCIQNLRI